MKPTRIVAAAVLVALVAIVATACGSSDSSVPSDDVAVVDGAPVTKAQLDGLIARAKATYKTQKRAFPKAGTAEYQSLQTQAVAYLVQRAEYENRGADLKLTVSDKEIDARIDQVKKQSFGGSQAKFDTQLKAQGYTTESLRGEIRAQLLSEKIYNAVTKDAKVTDAQVAAYYKDNKAQYSQAESRDVRHILVKTKAQADSIYNQLKAGANFAALAKKYSLDPGSKDNGGKLTIIRGQTVAPFDTTAFLLSTNTISRPVKTQYGYHVIQPISGIKPAKTTPLKDAKPAIEATLLDKAKTDAVTKWTNDMKAFFAKKVKYATGFAPPAAATDTTATTTG
jgi:foldase protein PrsA